MDVGGGGKSERERGIETDLGGGGREEREPAVLLHTTILDHRLPRRSRSYTSHRRLSLPSAMEIQAQPPTPPRSTTITTKNRTPTATVVVVVSEILWWLTNRHTEAIHRVMEVHLSTGGAASGVGNSGEVRVHHLSQAAVRHKVVRGSRLRCQS